MSNDIPDFLKDILEPKPKSVYEQALAAIEELKKQLEDKDNGKS